MPGARLPSAAIQLVRVSSGPAGPISQAGPSTAGNQGVWCAMNAAAAVAEKVAPAAQASPEGSADSPVTAVLGSDPVGPGCTDQAVPFQCRVLATGTGTPAMVCWGACPLAQMSVALAALILSTEISPAGLATIDQAVPFQCSMTAWLATLAVTSCTLLKPLPTAQALLAEIAVTPLSPVGSAVFAVFTIDQAVPL